MVSIFLVSVTFIVISEIFKDFNYKKQYNVNKYFIDLYFIDYKIAVECDEEHHNIKNDKIREDIIKKELNEMDLYYIYISNDLKHLDRICTIYNLIKTNDQTKKLILKKGS